LDTGVSNKIKKKIRAFGASFASKFLSKFGQSSFLKEMLKFRWPVKIIDTKGNLYRDPS